MGTYLDYTFTPSNPAFFGNQLGQSFQTENCKLAIYPSGVAGTTSLLIEARDARKTAIALGFWVLVGQPA